MTQPESDATKTIPNDTVVSYFFYVFVIISVLVGISVVMDLMLIASKPRLGFSLLLRSLPMFLLGVGNSMFVYVLASRTLK